MRFIMVLAFVLTLAGPAIAQDYKTILDIPKGATLINLSATERVEVKQDLLTATLRIQSESKNAKKVQDNINEIMTKALAKAKAYKDVKTTTQHYSVHQYNLPHNKARPNTISEKSWRGQQSLQIKSTNSDQLLELAGKLQALGMSMNGLTYSVSPALLEETRDAMLETALIKLKTKAQRAAKALEKSSSDLLEINLNSNGGGRHYPVAQPMMMKSMSVAEMSMDAPVAQGGESVITLTVSARAILRR